MKLLVLTVFACVLCGALAKNDPAAEKFINDFAKQLKKSEPELLKVANVPQAIAAKKYYKVVKKYLLDKGATPTNAEEVARTKSEAAAKNYDHITPDNKPYLLGTVLASGLEKIGKLNEGDASMLASEAAQDFDTVVASEDISSDEAKMKALFQGYDKFLERFGTSYVKLADTMNKAVIDFINAA